MIEFDYIDDILEALKKSGAEVTEPLPDRGRHRFDFVDLTGARYSIIGELVDIPLTAEAAIAFEVNVSKLIPLEITAIERLTEPAYIFFGRKSCPWSRRLAQQFPRLKTSLYWVDTEGTDASEPVRVKYNVVTVPTVIKRELDGSFVKFDGKSLLAAFIGEED